MRMEYGSHIAELHRLAAVFRIVSPIIYVR
jgi:hypothetical protein